MQLPFFILIHSLVKLAHLNPDGFSHIYQEIPNISAWFYTLLALIFAYKILIQFFSEKQSLISLGIIFLSTNWYYYAIDSTGMSHCYSAFLIILELYLTKTIGNNNISVSKLALTSFIAGLIVIIRPINVICLPVIYLLSLNGSTLRKVKSHIYNYPGKSLFGMICPFIAAFIPQFLYWKYAYGSYLAYSYGDEGFIYKYNPQIVHLWLSHDNGLLLYNPIYFLLLIIFVLLIIKKHKPGMYVSLLFFLMSYVYASWHAVSYGCSYGQRNYVDLSIFWCLAIGFSFQLYDRLKKIFRIILFILVIALSSFNLVLIYNYNKCFFSTTWDYTEYFYYFTQHWYKQQSYLNEELTVAPGKECYPAHTFEKDSPYYKSKYAKVSCEFLFLKDSIHSLVQFELLDKDHVIFSANHPLTNTSLDTLNWQAKEFTFELPKTEHRENNYQFIICNSSLRDSFKLRNIEIVML